MNDDNRLLIMGLFFLLFQEDIYKEFEKLGINRKDTDKYGTILVWKRALNYFLQYKNHKNTTIKRMLKMTIICIYDDSKLRELMNGFIDNPTVQKAKNLLLIIQNKISQECETQIYKILYSFVNKITLP